MSAGKRGIEEESACEVHSEGKKARTQPLTLYMLTPDSLLGFKLEKNNPEFPVTPIPFPPFETHIDLMKHGYPTGMGFLKRGSHLWFFGGMADFIYDFPKKDTPPNLRVFELNQSGQSLDLIDGFSDMQAFKRRPIVEAFRDKIFVLNLTDDGIWNQYPLLECLHVPTGVWKPLPNFPGAVRVAEMDEEWLASASCYLDREERISLEDRVHSKCIVGWSHFVAFNKILLPSLLQSGLTYCFDMDLEVWDGAFVRNLVTSFENAELHIPLFGASFSGLGSEDFSLILTPADNSVMAPLPMIAHIVHKSGHLMFHQELDLLKNLEYGKVYDGQILDLEDGHRMCVFMMFNYGKQHQLALYVCIFEVEILERPWEKEGINASSETFPTAQLFKFMGAKIQDEHLYHFRGICMSREFNYVKAILV